MPGERKGCMNKREIGTKKEQQAIAFLKEKGIRIVCCNFRTRFGEIDIIGKDKETLVFFEVKYRKDLSKGNPLEAVTYQKQKKICKVADFYRMSHGIHDFISVRFDVVAILGNEITWIRDAFPYAY